MPDKNQRAVTWLVKTNKRILRRPALHSGEDHGLISRKAAGNRAYMSLSTYYLEYGRHVARLRRRRAYAPTSNTAAHDNHEKINLWVSFCLYGYGAPLGGPLGRQSSVKSIFVAFWRIFLLLLLISLLLLNCVETFIVYLVVRPAVNWSLGYLWRWEWLKKLREQIHEVKKGRGSFFGWHCVGSTLLTEVIITKIWHEADLPFFILP